MTTIRQVLAAIGASGALAAGAQTTATMSNDRKLQNTLEEVVVTAQKREQDLQDVPISISVLGGDVMQQASVAKVTDLAKLVPNFSYDAAFGSNQDARVTLRGITGFARNAGFESGVSVYIDGVYAGRPVSQNLNLINVERVEVLRGPQGTLFGKNTIAGAINIVTKKPGEELEGKVGANFGNFERRNFSGYVSGPIAGDKLFAGASFFSNERDGYVRNLFNGDMLGTEGAKGGDVQLRYAGSNLDANLRADYLDDDSTNVYTESLDGTSNIPGGVVYSPGIRTINLDSTPREQREVYGVSLAMDYEWQEHTFTSITAYRKSDSINRGDNDNAPLDFLDVRGWTEVTEFASQEFRFASPVQGAFDYILGIYLFDQSVKGAVRFAAGVAHPLPGLATVFSDIDTTSGALFAHANYRLTDHLTLTGGVRYTVERKDLNDYHAVGPTAFGGLFDFTSFTDDRRDSDVSPMLSLSYAISTDVNVYAKAARGFKSGGWNTDFISRPDHTPPPKAVLDFDPERATTYELGIKSELLGRRLQLNLAAFQTDYEDLQVQRRILDPATNLFTSVFDNAASSTIKGAEAEFATRVTEGLSLRGAVGYTDAVYDSFAGAAQIAGTLVSFDGNRLAEAPKWSGSLMVDYKQPLVNDMMLSASFDYSYKGDFYTDASNRADLLIDSRGLWGGRIGISSDAYEVFLWGENLADKDYLVTKQPGTVLRGTWGMPRSYGVQMAYKF